MLNNAMPGSHLPVSYIILSHDGGSGRGSINQPNLVFFGVSQMNKTTRSLVFHYTARIEGTILWLRGKSDNQKVMLADIIF